MDDNSITFVTTPSLSSSPPPTVTSQPHIRPEWTHPLRNLLPKPDIYSGTHHAKIHPHLPPNFITNGPMDCHCGLPSYWDKIICCDSVGGCRKWFHFGCMRLSSDQVNKIKAFVCGTCEDFSTARTTYKTAEDIVAEAEAEEGRVERKRKAAAKKKSQPMERVEKRLRTRESAAVDSAVDDDNEETVSVVVSEDEG